LRREGNDARLWKSEQLAFLEGFPVHQIKCELCEKAAEIHETRVDGGAVVTQHFCYDHSGTIRDEIAAIAARIEPRLKTDPEAVLKELRQRVEQDPQFDDRLGGV
jgi:hypothetical protein